MAKKVKFGIFTDLHVDIMHDCEERLKVFLDECRKENVDFIIQLGDFCYTDEDRKCVCQPNKRPINIENALNFPTYANKDAIIKMFNDFEKPSYHVIGNHDCDMCTKKQILEYYGADYDSYYSFDMGGFHFVVLDGNFMRIDGEDIAYENGNYFDESYRTDKVLPYISNEQLKWLEKDLAAAKYPSILFSHQRLNDAVASVLNYEDLTKILVNAPNKVYMSINGHMHIDNAFKTNGIWYYNLNSMSNYWVDMGFVREGRYGVEIDEKYPNIKYVIPYKKSVFAIVSLDEKGATVKGVSGEYVGESPEEMDLYKGESFFTLPEVKHYVSPSIADRYMEF